MEMFLSSLSEFTMWLVRNSTQVSVVIGLVLLVQWLFKKKLSPRWRYCMWSLVLIRLMLPATPESAFSIFNYTQGMKILARGTDASETWQPGLPGAQATPSITALPFNSEEQDATGSNANAISASHDPGARTALSAQTPSTDQTPADKAVRAPILSGSTNQLVAPTTLPPVLNRAPHLQQAETIDQAVIGAPERGQSLASATRWSWPLMLSLIWLGGALFLFARIIWFPLRLNAQLAQHEIATGPAVFEVLEQSKRLMGVNRVLPIIQSRAVQSPALLGFIRPWLLLPVGMVERFTPQELRFVFLHELAHLKRRDIAVNWLMTILQILHWFNPLVWFAFSRMRADRELACDELALSFAQADDNKSYGQAIIKLLESFTRPAVLPGLVGILEDRQQMKRRITMIAQFKQMTQRPAAALTLLVTLGLVTLTDAQSGKNGTEEQTAKSVPKTSGGPVKKTLLTGFSDSQYNSVLAPDESKIAYEEWSGNATAVFVKDLKTGVVNKVTTIDTNTPGLGAVIGSALVWSPDSKQIAYCWIWHDAVNNKSTNNGIDLRIVSASGGQVKVIKSHNPEIQYNPLDWSTDAQTLLCELKKKDGIAALATVSIKSGEVRQLLSFPWETRPRHARFSPDGKFIAYERTENGNRDVYVLTVEGTQASRLTDWPSEESTPIWSADGKLVLFSSNRSGAWELLGIEVKNGKAVERPAVIQSDFGDRAKRMTRSGNLTFDLSRGGGSDVYLIEVNPATGESGSPKLVTKSFYGQHMRPTWSGDGKKLAYIRTRQEVGAPLLCVISLEDGREECFETGMRYMNSVSLSPDGYSAAVAPAGKADQYGIHLFTFATRELRPIVLSEDFRPKGFSADGKEFLLFQAGNRNENVAVEIATGKERKIEFAEKVGLAYAVSPDGARIVYFSKEPDGKETKLVLADINFKEKQVIARASSKFYYSAASLRWSPDGTKIAYPFQASNEKLELRIRAADGSWERSVSTGQLQFNSVPEWSPDSTKLALTLGEPGVTEIGVLENFLPKGKVAAASEAKPAAENNAEPVVKTLVSGNGVAGVLSPDERQVAYTDFSSVSGDLAVKDLRTGKVTKLTRHDTKRTNYVYEIAMNLVWSPDSRQVAYSFLNDTNFSVRLASVERGESKVLKENPELLYWPFDWSQDGKSLLCNVQKSWDKSMSLGIVSIETGEVRQLISLEWNGLNHARFSPDGKFIVYDREENENRDIFVLALESMRVRRLVDLPSTEDSPVWSSDGQHVLFSSDRTGQQDLWGIAVRNGEALDAPFLLRRNFGGEDYRMTCNGKLAFTKPGGPAPDCYYFDVHPASGEISGSPKLITTSFYGRQKAPAYSPDGLKVAYIRDRNPLCIQSLANGKVDVIKTDMQYFNRLFWSPDSKTIALQGRGKTGPLGIHLLSLETRQVTQLFAAQDGVGEPRGFSADSKEFYFGKDGKRTAVDVETRKERTIEFPKHEDYNYSPDGKQIVYVERDPNSPERKLIVSDSEFKEPKIIDRGEGQFLYRRWSPDGKMIAYNYNAKRETQQWGTELRVSAADGSWQKTPKTGKLKIFSTGHAPSWSADGTKLALTLSEEGPGEIGVLENFLPKETLTAIQR